MLIFPAHFFCDLVGLALYMNVGRFQKSFSHLFTRRTDDLLLQLLIYCKSFRADLCSLAHVAEWEPYDLRGPAHVSVVGSVLLMYRSPAQHILTTDARSIANDPYDLYDLYDLL